MAEGLQGSRSRKSEVGTARFSKKASSVSFKDPGDGSSDDEDEGEVIIWDRDLEDEDRKSLIPTSEMDKDGLVKEYEVALEHLGFGFFHIILIFVNGVALLSDAIEILAISFIFPVLIRNQDWGVGGKEQAILSSVIFVGMLFGSYVWGGLADVVGRRPTMILSLTISVVFGVVSAFSPWFWLFVAFRLLSGFGVGGSLPVIMTYSSEFIRNKYRGPYLSMQSIFWMFGRLLCGGVAWWMLTMDDFHLAGYQLHNWRVFLAVSALPSLIGATMYFIFPESPRYLLEVGRQKEALKILRLVHRINHSFTKKEYPVKVIVLDGTHADEQGNKTGQKKLKKLKAQFLEIFFRNIRLFHREYLRQTLLLLVVMFCLSFGGYGVTLWFPTYISEINAKRDAEKLSVFCNKSSDILPGPVDLKPFCGCNSTIFEDVTISDQVLHNWKINDVIFSNVTFFNVTFDSVAFTGTEFQDCNIVRSKFVRTFFSSVKYHNQVTLQYVDLLPDSLCISDDSEGNVFLVDANLTALGKKVSGQLSSYSKWSGIDGLNMKCSLKGGVNAIQCHRNDFRVYRDNFLVAGSSLPGNLASAVAVYYLNRNHWLAISMMASTLSVFLLYVATSEAFVVAMLCLFMAVSVPSWNDTSLIIAELYPTSLRSTAAGAHLLMARIGAIAGTNIFGLFVLVHPSVPILLVASLLCLGSLASIALPTTTRRTLLK